MLAKVKRIFALYKQLINEIFKAAPVMVIMTFCASVAGGLTMPLALSINTHIFDYSMEVAQGSKSFSELISYFTAFVIISVFPILLTDVFIYSFVQPRSQLILRTQLKGRMLRKIKKMKYEHFENAESMEIIDKAYNRTENAAVHLFPMYIHLLLTTFVGSIGLLYLFSGIKWWLLLTILLPFALETYLASKNNSNIYEEMEAYWQKERSYDILSEFLKTKEFLKENKLNRTSDYLIDTYKNRLNKRNREYEKYYYKNLKRNLTQNNITKLFIPINIIILLILFVKAELSAGLFISASLAMFTQVFNNLSLSVGILKWSGMHINSIEYYNKYFELTDDGQGEDTEIPTHISIEFCDVWFRYPNTQRDILKGLSFKVNDGEKISVVGENGEGKSTMVKLLLGLFKPDKGAILINGKPLFCYSDKARSKIFGIVFQDFVRYSISVKENVIIGNIDGATEKMYSDSIKKAKADVMIEKLSNKDETLLGRDFDGGVELSGGQWQRIAIARAFMGDKPAMILDEPTSQLDPMAESNLYSEFAGMAEGKTSIFITQRLASTMITDCIFVISQGKVAEKGTHNELMAQSGIYAKMFEAQKQWYQQASECEVSSNA